MNKTRQDAWSKDEDVLLAETVLRYIREGKTQLEAFQETAKLLSRTSAACGFRWNAAIRKQYNNAIKIAKARKKEVKQSVYDSIEEGGADNHPIDEAILLLKRIKGTSSHQKTETKQKEKTLIQQLQEENEKLKNQLVKFDRAWIEMGKLWEWVKENKT